MVVLSVWRYEEGFIDNGCGFNYASHCDVRDWYLHGFKAGESYGYDGYIKPGGNVTIGTVSPGKVLTVVYTDSINQPLGGVYVTTPGVLRSMYTNGHYVVAYTVLSGVGTLYLINNYSVPVTVKYSVVGVSLTSSLLVGGVLVLVAMVIGLIGVVLAILGVVLRPRR